MGKIDHVIDVSRGDEKLSQYLQYLVNDMKVLIAFFHGVGDCVLFQVVFDHLKECYPCIHFDIGICRGLDQELIFPNAVFLDGDWREKFADLGYDLVFSCNFPMSEGQTEYTKAEYCCIKELGISPVCGHNRISGGKNRLIGIHYNITCLPESCNPDEETARKIWNEVLESGMIPIETHFHHIFHNPVNKKFPFVDCSVRRVQPRISTLVGLIEQCYAFIGVVSGNFHVAMATKDISNVCLLEKDFKAACFTKEPIHTIDIKNYKDGSVKEWLLSIQP